MSVIGDGDSGVGVDRERVCGGVEWREDIGWLVWYFEELEVVCAVVTGGADAYTEHSVHAFACGRLPSTIGKENCI